MFRSRVACLHFLAGIVYLKFARIEYTEIEKNIRVSVDNFHWISFRTAEMAERGP